MTLQVRNLYKTFDQAGMSLFDTLSFSMAPGEVMALMGPSGAGKSSLLKILADRLAPEKGDVLWQGKPIHADDVIFVDQKFELDQNKSLFDYMLGDHPEHYQRVRELVEVFDLPYIDARTPLKASFGQNQRAHLAAALLGEGKVILLDEPFAHLDPPLKRELYQELLEWIRIKELCCIVATHQFEEAAQLAGSLLYIDDAKFHYFSEPKDFYLNPPTKKAAHFCSTVNWNTLKLVDGILTHPKFSVKLDPNTPLPEIHRDQLQLGIRPSALRFSGRDDQLLCRGKIVRSWQGHESLMCEVKVSNDLSFIVRRDYFLETKVNQKVELYLDPRDIILLSI
jgi:ABC-type Fe3+/spermidine/putrescine transport system ATPase subunit